MTIAIVATLFVVGAVCAFRVPILPFTLLVIALIAIYAVTRIFSADPFSEVAIWSGIYLVVVEAGYTLAHLLIYLIVVKLPARRRKKIYADMMSKYSHD